MSKDVRIENFNKSLHQLKYYTWMIEMDVAFGNKIKNKDDELIDGLSKTALNIANEVKELSDILCDLVGIKKHEFKSN